MFAINQLSNLGHHLIVVLWTGFYAWLHPFSMDSMDQDLFVPELVMGPAKRAAYDPPPVGAFSAVGVEHGTMGPWDYGNWAAKMGLHRGNATSTKSIVELRKRGIDQPLNWRNETYSSIHQEEALHHLGIGQKSLDALGPALRRSWHRWFSTARGAKASQVGFIVFFVGTRTAERLKGRL